jgi:hypothetical protein
MHRYGTCLIHTIEEILYETNGTIHTEILKLNNFIPHIRCPALTSMWLESLKSTRYDFFYFFLLLKCK